MTPFGAYKIYVALKSHFNTASYDVFKYGGRVNVTRESFDKRRDKHRFEKIVKTMTDEEIINMFVANFLDNKRYGGLFDERSEERYRHHRGYLLSLKNNFRNEVKALYVDAEEEGMLYHDVFEGEGNTPVLNATLGKSISLETFIILDRINSFTDAWTTNIITETVLFNAIKYSPFLKVETEDYANIERTIRSSVFG